jgi:subtilase family serine protease
VKRFSLRVLAVLAIAALAACGGRGSTGTSLLPSQPQSVVESSYTGLSQIELAVMQAPRFHACPQVAAPGEMTCFAILSNYSISPDAVPEASCVGTPGCYGPADLQAAYGVTNAAKTGGSGMTVGIVDAFGYPSAAKDLANYRKFFGLPACGSCLKIVNQKGQTKPLPKKDSGWDGEQALDLDMVSAICPKCNILLVQASDNSGQNLAIATATAVKMANVVSNSYGGPEQLPTFPAYDTHPGVVVTASAGDSGAGAAQPCSFAGVVCVGGTSLMLNNQKRVSEVVWDGLVKNQCGSGPCATGSGCSSMVPKPAWQKGSSVAGCTKRNESDISADADPYTGVVVALGGKLYTGDGGTSASSPMIAAMYALAGNTSTATPATLWGKGGTSAFNDITKGTNSNKAAGTFVCPAKIKYICTARPGYDGPTGWGTPKGLGAL